MKLHGYQVEYLPLERRLYQRRFIDTAPGFFTLEQRIFERRKFDVEDFDSTAEYKPQAKSALSH